MSDFSEPLEHCTTKIYYPNLNWEKNQMVNDEQQINYH